MFRFGNLRTRLLVVMLALSLPPLVLFGVFALYQQYDSMKRTTSDHLADLALRQSQSISIWIQERNADLGQMSDHCLLDSSHQDHMAWLRHVERTQPAFKGIVALNATGRIISSTSQDLHSIPFAEEGWFRKLLAGKRMTPVPFWDPALKRPAMVLAVPIPDNKSIVGVIAARIDLRDIEGIVMSIRPGQTGEAVLVGADGVLITGSRFQPKAAFKRSFLLPQERRSAASQLAVFEQQDTQRRRFLTVTRSIPETGWLLIVRQDVREAYAPTRRLFVLMLCCLGACLLAVVGVAFCVARRISAPLTKMVDGIQRIKQNQYDYTASVDDRDEVGQLELALQRMTEHLRASQQALEESRSELMAVNAQLEAHNQQNHEQLETLHDFTIALTSTLEVETVLQRMLEQSVAYLHADYGSILLAENACCCTNGTCDAFRVVYGPGDEKFKAAADLLDRTLAIEMAQTRQPLLIGNGTDDKQLLSSTEASSAMCVPLLTGEQLKGTIQIIRTHSDQHEFQEGDLRFLNAVARQAAIALHNADLYQGEFEQRRRLEQAHQQLDLLVAQLLTAQEQERRRIARELHDGTAQSLALMLRSLELSEALLMQKNAPRDEVATELRSLQQLARESIQEMRRQINNLRPPLLDDLGFLPAVQQYCHDFETDFGIPIHVGIQGDLPPAWGSNVTTELYRIIQEALNNIQQHANARTVSVHFDVEPHHFRMTIADDGAGFSLPACQCEYAEEGHFGVFGMRERAELLGGTFRIRSAPGQGTTIEVEILSGGEDSTESVPFQPIRGLEGRRVEQTTL